MEQTGKKMRRKTRKTKKSRSSLDKFSSLVDSIRAPREENLYLFLRNTFSISAVTGLYGPANPMAQDPTISDAQWTMEAKSLWVFVGLFNKFLFPKAFAARAAVQSAYGAYHSANGASETGVSAVIRSYVDLLRHYGFKSNDIGKSDVGIIHGATSNAALAFSGSSSTSSPTQLSNRIFEPNCRPSLPSSRPKNRQEDGAKS
jgi:hypothetical protein